MRERGNADATIIGRVGELAMAMTVLAPNVDHGWIRKPFGPTMYSLLPRRRRPLFVPSAGEMFAWGYTILEGAATKTTERERLVAFRDGLLVSLLAICARRLRAIAGLRVGHELVQTEKGYRLELPPELIKTKKYDLFDLPVQLTPHIDHYLHAVRPRLLQGAKDDAVWINERGKQCSPKLIQSRVFELSDHQFGVRFGPHRFRYSIATSGPHIDPENPAIGAEVLGISKEVLQQHYNRGNQAKAVRTFNACLEKRIAEAEKLLNPSGLPGKGHKQV